MPTREPTPLFARLLRRPEGHLVGAFAALILVGTVLLSSPMARNDGHSHPFDALFTATSAVCVTGLVVVDTGTDFSRFGQIAVLVLIQLGGLGIMTFAALVTQIAGHRLSLRSQAALQDVFFQTNAAARYRQNLKWIVLLTLVIEGIGGLFLYLSLPATMARREAGFVATFHAVSAFCNAGFSTFSDSLVGCRSNAGFMTTISLLIIIGGLGYAVLLEVLTRSWKRATGRPRPVIWSLNTRVVLVTSGVLMVSGAIIFDLLGLRRVSTGWEARAGNALFQSITARTAGFNTVDIGVIPVASLLWIMLFMFVGGSPGSCAGGVKTTSLAIWFARLKARIQHREDVTIGGRRIPVDLVRRTGLLIGVSVVYNLIGIMVLTITEMGQREMRFEQIIFEQVSAFATVGLSAGLTPHLTVLGKMWIILTMFVGRLGPLTLALVVIDRKPPAVRLPEERLMIG